ICAYLLGNLPAATQPLRHASVPLPSTIIDASACLLRTFLPLALIRFRLNARGCGFQIPDRPTVFCLPTSGHKRLGYENLKIMRVRYPRWRTALTESEGLPPTHSDAALPPQE